MYRFCVENNAATERYNTHLTVHIFPRILTPSVTTAPRLGCKQLDKNSSHNLIVFRFRDFYIIYFDCYVEKKNDLDSHPNIDVKR